jgi:hypothetical protein
VVSTHPDARQQDVTRKERKKKGLSHELLQNPSQANNQIQRTVRYIWRAVLCAGTRSHRRQVNKTEPLTNRPVSVKTQTQKRPAQSRADFFLYIVIKTTTASRSFHSAEDVPKLSRDFPRDGQITVIVEVNYPGTKLLSSFLCNASGQHMASCHATRSRSSSLASKNHLELPTVGDIYQ